MAANVIAFDIEVAGFAWDEVDEITRGYLVNREHDESKRAAIPERTALYPGLGKVIAIGMWLVGAELDRGLILLEGAQHEEKPWEKVPSSKIFRGSEEQLLARFWELVGRSKSGLPRLVTFNGRGYDGPMLTIRSAQLGIKPSRNLMGNRFSIAEHCDLADVFQFRFDIESPKGSIDGSQVARAYRSGRIDDIGEYCLRDVRATALLYQKVENTLIPLFQGG
jgi:hypothetical protein